MYLIDFNECKENHKAYGGMAGSKLGIMYQGEEEKMESKLSGRLERNSI